MSSANSTKEKVLNQSPATRVRSQQTDLDAKSPAKGRGGSSASASSATHSFGSVRVTPTGGESSKIGTKKVSQPGDYSEREADRVADTVLQRQPDSAFVALDSHRPNSTTGIHSGAPLTESLRADMEARFGHSFANVRVHANERSHHMAEDLQARAFTVGSNIHFAKGEFRPDSSSGLHLLAHELTHTLQQRQSAPGLIQRAPATQQINDNGNSDLAIKDDENDGDQRKTEEREIQRIQAVTENNTKEDSFQILGVSPESPWREVQEAYENLMRVLHPEMEGNREALQLVEDAYSEFETLVEDEMDLEEMQEQGQDQESSQGDLSKDEGEGQKIEDEQEALQKNAAKEPTSEDYTKIVDQYWEKFSEGFTLAFGEEMKNEAFLNDILELGRIFFAADIKFDTSTSKDKDETGGEKELQTQSEVNASVLSSAAGAGGRGIRLVEDDNGFVLSSGGEWLATRDVQGLQYIYALTVSRCIAKSPQSQDDIQTLLGLMKLGKSKMDPQILRVFPEEFASAIGENSGNTGLGDQIKDFVKHILKNSTIAGSTIEVTKDFKFETSGENRPLFDQFSVFLKHVNTKWKKLDRKVNRMLNGEKFQKLAELRKLDIFGHVE